MSNISDVVSEPESITNKKKKVSRFTNFYRNQLPNAGLYETSYNHASYVTHIVVSKTDFIITASSNGDVKFWKKLPIGIESVKHYTAHLGFY